MKNHISHLLISLILLLAAGQADASFWFQVIDVSPIEMMPGSEANFTVSVKGLGSERAYVELVFKNKTDGLDFSCPKMIKNVFPAGVTKYDCVVKAADVQPGNYSFVVDAAARGSPSGKKTAFINVHASQAGQDNQIPADTSTKQTAQKTPAQGAIVPIFAMLVAMRMMK
ncbi:MAG: hypothetical protein WCG94_06780 [Methanothrix sp.]